MSSGIDSNQVFGVLAEAMIERGVLNYICFNNGPQFVAKRLCNWLTHARAEILYIFRISAGERYRECFNSKMCDDFLNGGIFIC